MTRPRAVFAAPVFEQAGHLRAAVESLLGQTEGDLAVVLVDDASRDATAEVAREIVERDPRVVVRTNPARLGMLANTRRAFAAARELFPEAEYVALASDHDLWEPRWLEVLAAELDAHPRAVLAYPLTQRVDERGRVVSGAWRFETREMEDPRARARASLRRMVAGDMIYGLFRGSALAEVGTYRSVLVPDRLLLAELALRGEFLQVPELLWSRRFGGAGSLRRQRNAFFLGGTPAYARIPPSATHVGVILWEYGVHGRGPMSRAAGVRHALVDHLPAHLYFAVRARLLRAYSAGLGWVGRALVVSRLGRHVVRRWVRPRLRGSREAVDRLLEEAEERRR